ncbi:uncharacterized protein [Periplaneta americana]|uniref:uncharacterized protein isoform X4 n=1 Tax=Periplaneta americana TaxID=6978 RepID=UPI0037E7ACEA
MDLIMMEPEDEPFGLVPHENTSRMEENKASSEEGNLSHLEVSCVKTECVDQSYNIKSEIKVEDTKDTTPLPIGFPMVKSEVYKDLFDLDRLQQEQKVDVSSEVLTERNANLTRCSHYSNLTIRC